MRHWYFSSESVTEGHPDKVADAISDSVLDSLLKSDPLSRVACEVLVTTNRAVVAGEITSQASLDADLVTRTAVRQAGYDGFDPLFAADLIDVDVLIHQQSPDISDGVSLSLEARLGSQDPLDQLGAGDQGLMFGFAVDETEELMPVPIQLAHRLSERLAEVRKSGTLSYLRPDGKTQVTVEYEGSRPIQVVSILISTQHAPDAPKDMREELWEQVVTKVVPEHLLEGAKANFLVNPSGRFEIGGPHGDTGLTGRKIVVDTYGGYARHGGGAFSGKDPTKVDRSAAYAARHAAKNVVAAGLAKQCELQLAYAIGRAQPFSVHVETFGTEAIDPIKLDKLVGEYFDFRPAAIIERLDLRQPIYAATSNYGHFGRPQFSWESVTEASELAAAAKPL